MSDPELDNLISLIKSYNPEADISLIAKAYEFAEIAHAGQKRLSGEDYLTHPVAVAVILTSFKMDWASIAAALLHDVIEESGVAREELVAEFGEEIAFLVDGVTKVSDMKLQSSEEERFVENMRKMVLAMTRDLRVIIIKIADRLHNMRTIKYLTAENKLRFARESIDVFAPLAERLGMGEVKGELEDLSFPVLFPKEYEQIVAVSKTRYHEAEEFLEKATRCLYKELAEEGIRVKITSRPKHLFSLWRKMVRPEIDGDIDKVYDLVAMRILTKTVKDCYIVLGIIHHLWKPSIYGAVRDYISRPKPNGYQSIHSNVHIENRIVEIQIRTEEMHEQAEFGVAAHWHYAGVKAQGASDKQLESGQIFAPNEKLSWVKQLVAWQDEVVDSQEYLRALKFDALAHRIFVFSPKGDVYDLPDGASPIDFAYEIHRDLGHQAIGAKINGKMVKLEQKLKNGDVVEILKKEGTGPTEKWLRMVVTQKATREIKKYLGMTTQS